MRVKRKMKNRQMESGIKMTTSTGSRVKSLMSGFVCGVQNAKKGP
jgi:hypothetical protein